MASFEITLTDRSVETVDDAQAYQQEGPMTTFFCSDAAHGNLDAWSTRLASFRSAEVLIIRRVERAEAAPGRPRLDLVVDDRPFEHPAEAQMA